MHLAMFDIDGTLVNTAGFEDECYIKAIREVISAPIDTNWSNYRHATDSGILDQVIDTHRPGDGRTAIHQKVRRLFAGYITSYLRENRAAEIDGAPEFMDLLKKRDDVVPAIATGGWEETAKMKLASAGIDYSGIAFASGSDHKSRTAIMKLAEERCGPVKFTSKTYFGDAAWDQQACLSLGYNFILVGDRISHEKQIPDFTCIDRTLTLIGL